MRMSQLLMLFTLLLLPLSCFAVPTGLNVIPTADSLGTGQSRLEFESDGSGKLYVPHGESLIGSQAGFLLGIEGGADEVSGKTTVYNLKWQVLPDSFILPAVAVGAQNLAHGETTQYYLVATKNVLPVINLKLTAGEIHYDRHTNLTMAGGQFNLGPLVFKADVASAGLVRRSGMSLGYTYKGFTVAGTLYDFKNQPSEKTVSLSYTQGIF